MLFYYLYGDIKMGVEVELLEERQEKALVVKNLSKNFAGAQVLRDVSLTVEAGERRVIIGPNGAGKTTLFNLICGEFSPSHGVIRLFGEDITRMPAFRRCNCGLARTFQITNLFPNVSVLMNIVLAGLVPMHIGFVLHRPWTSQKRLLAKTEQWLKQWNLWEQRDTLVKNLSYGVQRQVEIIMALAGEPKLLLLDEPTAGLADEEVRSLLHVIDSLGRDITILFIEHDMEVAFTLADQVTVLNQGAVIAEGPPEEIRQNHNVQDIYLRGMG